MRYFVKNYGKKTENSILNMDNWDSHYILREWQQAKDCYLSKIFDGNLILRKQIKYTQSTDIPNSTFDIQKSPKCIKELLQKFEQSEVSSFLHNFCAPSSLAKTIYTGATVKIPMPEGEILEIKNGCSIFKTIGKLIKAFNLDIDEFEQFCAYHSQVLNPQQVNGTLCLSIHPLDYITMSNNDCGWESCVLWDTYGCYRQSTIEMMNSPYVVVAYLEEDPPMLFDGKEWNNKKWRELYMIHPDIITNIKGYPYCNEILTKEVLQWIYDLVQQANIWESTHFEDKIYHYRMRNSSEDEVFEQYHSAFFFDAPYTFNDFGHDCNYCYVNSNLPEGQNFFIDYNGASECVLCGTLNPEFIKDNNAPYLLCKDCEST